MMVLIWMRADVGIRKSLLARTLEKSALNQRK